MTERLTLAQAQDAIRALFAEDGNSPTDALAGLGNPREFARVTLLGLGAMVGASDVDVDAQPTLRLVEILERHQAHLDHEAGRAFELAAVQRFVSDGKQAMGKTGDVGAFMAFSCLLDGLATGVHHAEPKEP